ncbi:procathepsin L-like [Liolophura sinensis]|uniref:procathepsin L-like n=1 Tax=Liolophura sinensis TaxID=3198878 RepID=UPI0031589766
MKTIIDFTCSALLLAEYFGHVTGLPPTDEWEKFKVDYGKVYEGTEDVKRHQIWKANVKFINQHNREANKGRHSYRLGVNAFADMEVTNWTVTDADNGSSHYVLLQGMCASPWAFAVTGATEARNAIYCPPHKLVSLSEQNLVDCSNKYGNFGCEGGLVDQAYGYIINNGGIDTEASYPYEARNDKCRFNPGTVGADIRGCVDLPKGNETAMQIVVFTNGPVAVGLHADLNSFTFYKSGVYDDPLCTPDELDHAALVVGYGMIDGKKYWIVKNSYGESWGERGYILIARDHGNRCGISNYASYPEMLCQS